METSDFIKMTICININIPISTCKLIYMDKFELEFKMKLIVNIIIFNVKCSSNAFIIVKIYIII